MSALVGYGSSSEDEDDIEPEKPAKIARTAVSQVDVTTKPTAPAPPSKSITIEPDPPHNQDQQPDSTVTEPESIPIDSPAPGPSAQPKTNTTNAVTPSSPPASPYTTTRQTLRDLTMPTHPNFNIPPSPSPPPPTTEEFTTLAATTKKLTHFLALKSQGVHFHSRLESSSALRNPSLLPKLMEFAGIGSEESYASTLPEELGVPVKWDEGCYVEALVKENERKTRRSKEGRTQAEFVKGSGSKSGSASASRSGSKKSTPKGGGGRKSGFDRR